MVTWASGNSCFHGLGQQVGGGMADDLQAILVALSDNRELGILLDDIGGVHQLAVHPPGQGGLGQAGADVAATSWTVTG